MKAKCKRYWYQQDIGRLVMAKDQARRYPAPREYNDEDWCYSPFCDTEYTDGEPRGVQND